MVFNTHAIHHAVPGATILHAISNAARLASYHGHAHVFPIRLAVLLYNHPSASWYDSTRTTNTALFRQWIERTDGNPELLGRVLMNRLLRIPAGDLVISLDLEKVFDELSSMQISQDLDFITIGHLVEALMHDQMIRDALEQVSHLMKYTVDMITQAEGEPSHPVGREEEVSRLTTTLVKCSNHNPILVGDFGVGKSSIVRGLAHRMACGKPTKVLSGYRLLSLNFEKLKADSLDDDHLKELIGTILNEVSHWNDRIILVVDEDSPSVNALFDKRGGILLRHMLSKSQARCIVVFTPAQHQRYVETQSVFQGYFGAMQVNELSVSDTASVLRSMRNKLETESDVTISDGAIITAAILAQQCISDVRLPTSAISLIDQAVAQGSRTIGSAQIRAMAKKLRSNPADS